MMMEGDLWSEVFRLMADSSTSPTVPQSGRCHAGRNIEHQLSAAIIQMVLSAKTGSCVAFHEADIRINLVDQFVQRHGL